jgi:nicotinamide phosphoribosyltransferase
MGTDTFIALDLIREYYGMDMAGYSIPALEHSCVIAWENEDDAYQNVLNVYLKENSIVACVSDSTDFKRVNVNWGTKFKEQIEKSGGRVVVRHDSGNPLYNSIDAIKTLLENFGYTINSKGFKVLPNCVRFIWGDGTNYEIIDSTLYALMGSEIASENMVFGMGGGLLQRVDRDLCSFAFKINEVVQDDVRRSVYKHPVTGKGKASKPGRQALILEDGQYRTIPERELGERKNILRTVFKDGKLLIDEDFEIVRKRAN